MRRVLPLLAPLALLGLIAAPAHAAQTEVFGAAPEGGGRSFEVHAAGETRSAVRVWNRSAEPVELRIYAAPAAPGADGVWSIGYRGQPVRNLDVAVARSTVRLAVEGSAVVPVVVQAGGDAGTGAVVVEAAPTGEGIELVERIALLVRPTRSGGSATGGPVRGSVALLLVVALAVIGRGALARRRRTAPISA